MFWTSGGSAGPGEPGGVGSAQSLRDGSPRRQAQRRRWAQLFDEYAAALLASPEVLAMDQAMREQLVGRVLIVHSQEDACAVTPETTREALLGALIAECERVMRPRPVALPRVTVQHCAQQRRPAFGRALLSRRA